MTISWFGFNYFKFQNTSHSLILNPYSLDEKTTFSKVKKDLVLFSDPNRPEIKKYLDNQTLVIDSQGEYEKNDIFVYGKNIRKHLCYLINFEGIKIAFLGEFGHHELENSDLELIEGVDVLILPVGGGDLTSAKEAIRIVNQIEPRIVIPSCHADNPSKMKLDDVSIFIKEFGGKAEELDKIKINKKDLQTEDVKLIILKSQK
ncbi:hypothetical protein HON36_00245 [Candidatus Parcubacteria bacterium]|nr:hypothetical protein [Candidatus Parcubacteria bacterium]